MSETKHTKFAVPSLEDHPKHGKVKTKRPAIPYIPSDRASRRVIAPFLGIVRKDKRVAVPSELSDDEHIKSFLEKKPSILTTTLKDFADGMVELPVLIHETIDALRSTTGSVGVRLYMIDDLSNEIFISPREDPLPRNRLSFKIEEGKSLAAHVAAIQDAIVSDDIMVDTRFTHGVPFVDLTVKAVMGAPILMASGVCFGVVELYKDCGQKSFSKSNQKITLIVLAWVGMAIYRSKEKSKALHQRQLNDCLIELTKTYFDNNITIEKVINELVKFAKSAVNAERASFFVVRPESELVADLYDQGFSEEGAEYVKRLEKVKFIKEKGIAAYVAKTKECANIRDAYNDPRFYREIDQITGLITRSVLCVPILASEKLLGIIQAVNKATGECFNEEDEEIFKTFAAYSCLSLQHSHLKRMQFEASARYQIILGVLKRHIQPSEFELNQLKSTEFTDDPETIHNLSWYISLNRMDDTPRIAIYLITSVVEEGVLNMEELYKFVLCLKSFYRNNPYHNWEHAFNVCHCISTILKLNTEHFSDIEKKSLVVSALAHDVDHGGVTNSFLHLTQDIMASLYEESTWECHHYNITMILLGENQIYNNCSSEEYKEICECIRMAILATDLVNYFKVSSKLRYPLDDHTFDMANPSHKSMMIGVIMTVCDLSGQCKCFDVTRRITMNLYDEFYHQGDIEKGRGFVPLSMMDREKQYLIATDQVNFLNVLVIPCCDMLRKCLSNTAPLYFNALDLKQAWQDVTKNKKKDKMWSVV